MSGSSTVQATVLTFDAAASTGSVVTDSGLVHVFEADALQGSGLRLLRLGQRISAVLSSDGAIERLTIITLARSSFDRA